MYKYLSSIYPPQLTFNSSLFSCLSFFFFFFFLSNGRKVQRQRNEQTTPADNLIKWQREVSKSSLARPAKQLYLSTRLHPVITSDPGNLRRVVRAERKRDGVVERSCIIVPHIVFLFIYFMFFFNLIKWHLG